MTMSHSVATAEVLSDAELRSIAPSIFAEGAHETRSDRFCFVPTIDIINGLRKEGFMPVWAGASKSRMPDRKGHGKHMVRFRRDVSQLVAGSVPEVVLVNAHDGSAAYRIDAGSFRFVCANGMICADGMSTTARVKHSGDVLDNVIEGTFEVIKEADEALAQSAEWQGITLKRDEQEAFAEMALIARFGYDEEEPGKPGTLITPDKFLRARRADDREIGSPLAKRDVFHTMQVLQENAMKGGILSIDPKNHRRSRTRPVNGIDQTLHVNKTISALAKMFADRFGS